MQEIIDELRKFNSERNWHQAHSNIKNLAEALSVEASELLELFLWKTDKDVVNKERLKEELADVFIYSFIMADKCGFDIKEIVFEKMKKNGEKYPILDFLINKQEDLKPEFSKTVDKYFWELS